MKRSSGPVFVALTSVVAAVGLTAFKLVVGLKTGSLGILSEFAHSGLDLVAALITFFAVRAAARPPDPEHLYGHGKVENLSALVETLLLLATCGWIAYEAVHRLVARPVPVQVTAWSFIVMGVSIIVDVSRSRALARAAKKYNSQALEADALHFSTDIWSSAVVILGLVAVLVGRSSARPDLWWRADSIAALGVAVVASWVCVKLGRRTIDALVDRAPAGLHGQLVAAVAGVAGVTDCERLRVRPGGAIMFVDVSIAVAALALEASHRVAHEVEAAVQAVSPGADVVVHMDPKGEGAGTVPAAVHRIALVRGLEVHSVAAHSVEGSLHVTMHLEVDPALSLSEARGIASGLEAGVREDMAGVSRVDIHLEPREADVGAGDEVTAREAALRERIRAIALSVEPVRGCHDIHIDAVGGVSEVALHVTFDPDLPVVQVHEASHRLEERLRAEIDGLGRVSVQAEPPGE
ncbi:MAG: cation diffusion facilitator family transporter [Deltaproteobacteria bacterium]|nr:cation diffusion facilitator family transporter [Deltaproteobacteria bacterium]